MKEANKTLLNRLSGYLSNRRDVEEKFMFGGIWFMVDNKLFMGVKGDELMCRLSPEDYEKALKESGVRSMKQDSKPMIGYILVDETAWQRPQDFTRWANLCMAHNPVANSSKKKK